jgi:hypothetical protein
MQTKPVDVEHFRALIQSCTGPVSLSTAEGDKLVVDSTLCHKLGLELFLLVAQKLEVFVDCEDKQEQSRIQSYLNQLSS